MRSRRVVLFLLFVALCIAVGLHAVVPAQTPQGQEVRKAGFPDGWGELGVTALKVLERLVFAVVLGLVIALVLKAGVKDAIAKAVVFVLKEPTKSAADRIVDIAKAVRVSAEDFSSFLQGVTTEGLPVRVRNQFVTKEPAVKEEYKAAIRVAETYRDNGEFGQAIQEYENLLSKGIKDADILSSLGICYSLDNKPEKAIELLKQATNEAPEDPRICHNLGSAYYRAKEYANAIEWLEKSKKLDSVNHQTYIYLGLSFWKMGRFGEAVVATKVVLEKARINDERDVHWIALANNNAAYYLFDIADKTGLVSQDGRDEARKMINIACRLKPDNAKFLDTKGCVYLWEDDVELAHQCFERALRMEPRPLAAEHFNRTAQLLGI
jgi:tetratricopeptide (TPR) repeat protein